MRKKFCSSIVLLFYCCLLLYPSLIMADNTGLPNMTISLDLRDMEINEALKFLAKKAGLNIIPTKDVSGRITLMVEDVSLADVFDIMLRSNSLAYEKTGNIYNIMSEKEYKGRFGKNFADLRQVRIFHLKYAIPDQALAVLDTIKSEIGKVLLDADSGTLMILDTPDRIKEMESALSSLEQKCVIRIFDLKYARAKEVEDQLKLQLDVKKVGSIKSDERTNQVIVQTLPERMVDIAKLITGLDKKTKQILVDAKIIQVQLTDSLSSGIQWEGLFNLATSRSGMTYLGSVPFAAVQSSTDPFRTRSQVLADTGGNVGSFPFTGTTSNLSGGTQSIGSQQMHFGVVGKNDFDTIIQYLKTLGQTRVLSNPKLSVINNQEAKIHVGEKQAYITTTTTASQSTTTVSEAVTYIDVGVQLFVTPTINDDGFVTLKIKPEISSVTSFLKTSSNNSIPIVNTSTAETVVMVKDGTSLLIGGLSKEEKDLDTQGTPFLSKIPLLGEAFKKKTQGTTRTELMVLITPHIITGDELTTGYERDFGHKMDKEYQAYGPMKEEAPVMQSKTYQGYPNLKSDVEKVPELKPARNF